MNFSDDINPIALIAERKILEAMAEGQFDNLSGYGRPQRLEDLSGLPEDLRLAYMVLKNSNYLEEPPETFRATTLPGLLSKTSDEGRDCGRLERLSFMLSRVHRNRQGKKRIGPDSERIKDGEKVDLEAFEPAYLDKLLKRNR